MKILTPIEQNHAINLLCDCKLWLGAMKFETPADRKEAKRIKKRALNAISPWIGEWMHPVPNIEDSTNPEPPFETTEG